MKSNRLRIGSTVAAALATTALVAACSSPLSGGDGSSEKTLTVTAFDSTDVEILRGLGKTFEAEHEGWKVQVTQVPEANYVTKLRLSVKAGNPPDVAYLYALGELANFQPLDELMYEQHDIDPADYNEAILNYSCGYEDQLYCIGGYAGVMGLYYNKDAFKEAGVPFPSATAPMTFEEYATMASKLTQASDSSSKPTMWGGHAQAPHDFVDPGIFMDDEGKRVELTNPDYVETWTTLTTMVLDGDAPSPTDMSRTNSQDLFAEGRLAMSISDNFVIQLLSEQDIDWGVAPTPVQPGQESWATVWTNAYGVPKSAAHPNEAAEFLALLATEGQELQAENGFMPLQTKAAISLFGSKGDGESDLVQVSQHARQGTFTPNLYAWLNPLNDAWVTTATGKEGVLPALEKAQSKAQQGADATWETWNQTVAGVE